MSYSNPPARAFIVNVGIAQADENFRRVLSTFSLNFLSPNNSIEKASIDMAASGTKVFNSAGASTALTILRCSSPVSVTYVLLPVGTIRTNSVTVTQLVNSFLAIDDNVGSFTINNPASSGSNSIIFIQG